MLFNVFANTVNVCLAGHACRSMVLLHVPREHMEGRHHPAPPPDPGWLLSPQGSLACSRVQSLHEAWGTQNVLSLSGQALSPPKAPTRSRLSHVLPSMSSGRTQRASPTDGKQEEATNAQAFLAADGQGGGGWAQPKHFSLHAVPFALDC